VHELRKAGTGRPDAGVKLATMLAHCACDGDKKARSPGRLRRKPLKPFACGNAGCSGCSRGDDARVLFSFCTRGRGRWPSARHSLRPLLAEGGRFESKARVETRRDRGGVFGINSTSLRGAKQRSNPRSTNTAVAATPLPDLESELRSPRTPQRGRERREKHGEVVEVCPHVVPAFAGTTTIPATRTG
jgi:hypothetical protein